MLGAQSVCLPLARGLRRRLRAFTGPSRDMPKVGLQLTLEAPDEECATAFLLDVGSWGAVRTTTLRAYDREEMSGIIDRLEPS